MRILIVGAGIGGPTLAYWLSRSGHEVTLVERAPAPRTGGYLVDFWGAGFDIAEKMGITPTLMDKGVRFREVRQVDGSGRQIVSLNALNFFGDGGKRYVSVARTDLASTILSTLESDVETIFGDTVDELRDDGSQVRARFAGGDERDFDIVVGADGLHSRVRGLTFGPESAFDKDLGIAVAAVELDNYPSREEGAAVMYTEVGMQATRLSLPGDVTMVLFTFRHDGRVPLEDTDAQHELLRQHLRGCGWEVPAMLDALPRARSFYLDRASQIRMPSWARGRIALVGDAAACPSLLAGQGSALAMVEAYVLAAELHRSAGDHAAAFAAYDETVHAVVRRKQDAAVNLGAAFAPRTRTQLMLRNAMMRLMSLPGLTNLAVRRNVRDRLVLPPP